jgi:hypothetical protein
MNPKKIEQLQNVCKVVSELKSQLIQELPHYGHQALFFQNDEITTGQLNNKTEIKIHLLSGQLLFFHNEEGFYIDLTKENISEKLQSIAVKYNLKLPETPLENVTHSQLSEFYDYAIKAKRTIELFRFTLDGKFTLAHLWSHHFDFSVEWFTGKKDEQIGTGISPGDEQYDEPYLYMNPYPFNPKVTKNNLPIGTWHTSSWKGIKVDREDLAKYPQNEVTDLLHQLFLVAKKNFSKL